MSIFVITKDNVEEQVLRSPVPVLLDFWAPSCAPCMALFPAIEQIARDTPEIKVGKINVDEQPELAVKFRVMSIPTIKVVRDGAVAASSTNVRGADDICKLLAAG